MTPGRTQGRRLTSSSATPAWNSVYIDETELRFGVGQFTRQLLRDKKLTIGRLDGRLTGPSPLNAGETADFDPSGTLTRPPFQHVFLDYVRNELGYKSDMTYYVSGGIMPWDWGTQILTRTRAASCGMRSPKTPT